MNAKRLAAIIAIYMVTAIAWMILGGATSFRSEDTYGRLASRSDGGTVGSRATVEQLWGNPQTQPTPKVWAFHTVKEKVIGPKGKPILQDTSVRDAVALSRSRLNVDLRLEPRQKGLLWYSTYKVQFAGDYSFKNEFPNKREFTVGFEFPDAQTAYDNVLLYVDGKRTYPGGDLSEGLKSHVTLVPGQTASVRISYGSQGMDTWIYRFSDDSSVASVRDFEATMKTNCRDIDFPENCVSPTHKQLDGHGWNLKWKYGDLISGRNVGVSMPHKLNPGPFASRLSYFAPVSLLFFFAVLLIVSAVRDIRLHPVHYLMLAATFFSFHLLFSYMVDHVTPFYAFLVSSAVSMLLTISYLRLAVNWKFAVFHAGGWQFVFLVLFTYAFFFEGYTGLTITIGAILTLAVLMQMTGRVNWEEKLSMPPPPPPT